MRKPNWERAGQLAPAASVLAGTLAGTEHPATVEMEGRDHFPSALHCPTPWPQTDDGAQGQVGGTATLSDSESGVFFIHSPPFHPRWSSVLFLKK